MTQWEAIQKRTSRRSYSGEMKREDARKLASEVAAANVEGKLSMRFLDDGSGLFGGVTKSYGMFSGVKSLIVLAGRKGDAHLEERCGYYGEKLVLIATQMGLGTCWVGGTFDHARMEHSLDASMQLVAVITVGPVRENKGFVEKAVKRLTGLHKKAQELYSSSEVPPKWFLRGVEAASRAPSAINRQPVRFMLNEGAVTAFMPDDSRQFIDLGIAKLHFEIGAEGKFAIGNRAVFTKNNIE